MSEGRRTDGLLAAARLAALALASCALALVCITFTRDHGLVAAIWPGNAVVLAVLLQLRKRAWIPYVAAAVVGYATANLVSGDNLLKALVLATGNGVEILTAAAICRAVSGHGLDVTHRRHLLGLAAAAIVAPITSALFGTLTLGGPPMDVFPAWYRADALGLLIVTPSLLALALDRKSVVRLFTRSRSLAPAAALTATLAVVFGQPDYPLLPLLFPPLVWCAFTMGAGGTALVLLVTTLTAVVATLNGLGPMATMDTGLADRLGVLQVMLVAVTLVTLPLTAVLAERRRLNASLRAALDQVGESEARYRMLADNASDVILKIDASATIRYASPSIRQFGHAPEDLVGRPIFEFIHPDDRAELISRASAVAQTGTIDPERNRTYRVLCKDGGYVWAEGNPTIVRDAEGNFAAVVTQIRDISARKQAEAALADGEARYRLLADHATDVILKVDKDDVILYVSPSADRYGYAPEDLLGRSGYTLVHPDDLPKVRDLLGALFRTGQVDMAADRTYRIRKADGDYAWMEGNPSLVRNEAGEVEAVISQLRDVSARLQLEDELLAARDDAEAAAASKAEFMANMSHEIRTPLTAVLGFTSLLAGRDDLADDARAKVDRIGAAGQAMLAIVNDILDFSKLEAGLMPVTPRPVRPLEVLEMALSLFEPQAAAKGLTLAFQAEGLPEHATLDPDRVRQVLLNLIGNAVKFTEAGTVEVSASYDAAAGRLRVAVRDSGAGMTEEQQAVLFQRFSQVDGAAARAGGGTGLGLAISRGLVEAMGGEIGLSSALGEGSTFAFEIPAPECEAVETASDASPLSGVAGLRILLADDNPTNCELARAVMEQFEIEVTDAPDGAQAVELAALMPYDVILLDIRMPGMDGPTAARLIRAEPGPNQTTPILAFSADHELDPAVADLFDGHVRKPIEIAPLLEALAEATAWEDAVFGAAAEA
jgi:PAS domain S-box-containing protein